MLLYYQQIQQLDYYSCEYMQEIQKPLLQSINPLIKIIKERQQCFFEVFLFVNKNINSSSNDLDSITIFNKFINAITHKSTIIKIQQQQLLATLIDDNNASLPIHPSINKEMLRFSSRLLEILEASAAKIRKTIFDEKGRAQRQFTRFKINLNNILKKQPFNLKEYYENIINYTSHKYNKQISKLQKYVQKIQQGEDLCLRDIYLKDKSDHDPSSEDKKHKMEEIVIKNFDFKLQIKKISPQNPHSHDKKLTSIKKSKPSSSLKKRERPHPKRKIKEFQHEDQEYQIQKKKIQKPTKQQTANKLLKFYALLQLSKKQFLQDYVYDEIQADRHKQQLYNKLVERNKNINSQISTYVRKSNNHIPVPVIMIPPPNKSSGDQKNQNSLNSRMSLRTSFVISKRKSSFQLQSSPLQKKQDFQKPQPPKNIKYVNPRRRSSHSNPKNTQKSIKKLFVVKEPMIFEDEMIPQIQVNQAQWAPSPHTNRYRQLKNENIRLKKKNNPNPMDNMYFPQNFKYPF